MPNSVKYIIVHHTERNNDFPAFVKFRHRYLRRWDDIGYHYLIGNRRPFTRNGYLYTGRSENHHGAHALGFNEQSLGVCLIGNLDKNPPSLKQWETLIKLLVKKVKQHQVPVENIQGHNELSDVTKSCPGKNLDMDKVRMEVLIQINHS